MRNLRMELQRVQFTLRRGNRRDRASLGARQDRESIGRCHHQIAMAHPDLLGSADAAEERISIAYFELRESIFAVLALLNTAAESVRDQLLAVADAENR